MITFGPIPSRRLGRSLGINNIPTKVCSFSCIYCQVGATDFMTTERKEYFTADKIFSEVSDKITQLRKTGNIIDYLSFVPNGEPTLDINLGESIERLKSFDIKIAVITNSSLLWNKNVRNDLMKADWVSVKIDTADENMWHKINRPNGRLEWEKIFEGIKYFASSFKGVLVTETMLVKGYNDKSDLLQQTAQKIKIINPHKAYILIPTRPPAERNVKAPSENNLNTAYNIFSDLVGNVELLISSEGRNFSFSSDPAKELLSILAVHPMQKAAVGEFLVKAGLQWKLVDNLIDQNILKEIEYSGNFYLIKNK